MKGCTAHATASISVSVTHEQDLCKPGIEVAPRNVQLRPQRALLVSACSQCCPQLAHTRLRRSGALALHCCHRNAAEDTP